MGRYIIKLQDYYLEWSTVVDAPVTFGMNLEDFREYYKTEYGVSGARDLQERLERVNKYGTSSHRGESAGQMMAGNRAGPNEDELTFEEVFKAYCLLEPIKDGWLVPTESGVNL